MSEAFLNFIIFLYNLLFHNFGLTVIALAILTRIVFYPLTKSQLKYSQKMNELKPKLDELSRRHKNDKQKLQAAQLALYKEHGINPAAGCLPLVLQLIIFGFLYNAFYKALNIGLNTGFGPWNLAMPDVVKIPFEKNQLAIPGILVILAAITQFIQSKMMMPEPVSIKKEDKPREKEEKTEFADEFASAQGQMIILFPLMFLFFGTQWPSGLALYWTASTILAIIQQYQLTGWGGLTPWIRKISK
jgi:YidC/Oxa1 family membrane protein insertase